MDINTKKYNTHLIYIFLAIVTFAAFEPILHNGFISFDDDIYIYQNSNVTSGLTLKNVIWAFTNVHANNYHPLTSLSHMLDCEIFKVNPGGHHFVNLLFHIANTLVLFTLLSRMTKKVWASAFVAALFALHPLHVESVAWASERKDTLSTFFWLLTMWAYVRYCCAANLTPGTGPRAKHYYLLTVVFFAMGLLSKPMLVTLPFALLLLDYWPLGRFGKVKFGQLIGEKIPLLALSAVSSIITFAVQLNMGIVKSVSNYALSWRVENAIVSYIVYILKMFWPTDLAIFYPHPKGNIPLWQIAGAVLILLVITFLALRQLSRRPYIITGWLWFLGTLVPVIGIFQVGLQARADRYTYIPYIGLFIIIVWGVSELSVRLRHRKIILSITAGVLISALAAKTYIQTIYWHDDASLYTHAIKAVKDNWWAHHFLGKTFARQKEYEEAVIQFKDSLLIDPQNATVCHGLAKVLLDKGDVNDAVILYRKLLPPLPDDLNEPRKIDTSRIDYPELKNLYVSANINFATALARQGNFAEAARHFKEAMRLAPDAEAARKGLEDIINNEKHY